MTDPLKLAEQLDDCAAKSSPEFLTFPIVDADGMRLLAAALRLAEIVSSATSHDPSEWDAVDAYRRAKGDSRA